MNNHILILSILSSSLTFAQTAEPGPTYNFNFYNKDSIPGGNSKPSSPFKKEEVAKQQEKEELKALDTTSPQSEFSRAKIGAIISYISYSAKGLIGYDIGFKQRFSNGLSYTLKPTFGMTKYGIGFEKSFYMGEESLFNWGFSGTEVAQGEEDKQYKGRMIQTYLGPEFLVAKYVNISINAGVGRGTTEVPIGGADGEKNYKRNRTFVSGTVLAYLNF